MLGVYVRIYQGENGGFLMGLKGGSDRREGSGLLMESGGSLRDLFKGMRGACARGVEMNM